MRFSRILLLAGLLLSVGLPLHAHPIASRSYERTVVVHLTASGATVNYHLVLEELTAQLDLLALRDKTNLADLTTRKQIRDAFLSAYAPILADNIVATLNQKPLTFHCTRKETRLQEGHIRCDLTFESEWQLRPDETQRFDFRDGNYENEAGPLLLSLTSDNSIAIGESTAPDETLQSLSPLDRKPGDEDRLQTITATFTITDQPAKTETPTPKLEPPAESSDSFSLQDLVGSPERGFWMLMLLAAAFGAVHALTPGHGKTLVAAYLVGERGTIWHALALGLITTWTHTGAVVVLAAVLWFFPFLAEGASYTLRLTAGLLVAGMGLWLLLRRLSGQADHFHVGGRHSHHHHGPSHHQHGHADHYHDEEGHAHPQPETSLGWWSLIVLGVSGGIVPCVDAILTLLLAATTGHLWLGLPLLLSFSAGLAAVLILIGIFVVKAKGFAGSRWGDSRLFRMLPVASAATVTILGLWLCYTSVH